MSSDLNVLIGKRPAEIGIVKLSLSESENHEFRSEVTQYPVEDGSNMSDHIVNNPDKLTIQGFVTNSPISTLDTSGPGNGESAFEALLRIHRTREPVRVFTTLKEYENMALVCFSVPKNAETGETLRFSASFVHIRKVNSAIVETAAIKSDASDMVSSEKKAGKQNTIETPERKKSWLSSLSGFGG
jgi:hypothetical protein